MKVFSSGFKTFSFLPRKQSYVYVGLSCNDMDQLILREWGSFIEGTLYRGMGVGRGGVTVTTSTKEDNTYHLDRIFLGISSVGHHRDQFLGRF